MKNKFRSFFRTSVQSDIAVFHTWSKMCAILVINRLSSGCEVSTTTISWNTTNTTNEGKQGGATTITTKASDERGVASRGTGCEIVAVVVFWDRRRQHAEQWQYDCQQRQ
jgi:hypothetical protein